MVMSYRERVKQGLGGKTEDAFNRKDSGGLFKSYIKDSLLNERKISKFNPGKGTWIIDIIPYTVGKNDPLNKEGESQYVLDILVHMGVGAADERIVCLSQYNLPCPVCELIKKKQSANEDYKTQVKPLVAKRRTLYNVVVRDNPDEEKKGVQVLEIAHFFLQKTLAALSKNKRAGGYVVFSDPDDGKSISFERTGTGAENTAYSAHKFEDRPEPISDKELEAATSLDDYLTIRSYDDIYAVLHAGAAVKEEYVKEKDEEVPEEPIEPQDKEEEVPDPAPSEKKAAGKRTRKDATPTCPIDGGVFGETLDEFDACDTCAFVEACAEAVANK